ncbi:MAG TPA: hypothetical protein VFW38_07165 [Solirubrobacteraceae bacterium]|nr:hypothetical protein [Solirubrobacteraceae bacterium]
MNSAATSERERAIESVTRLSIAEGPLLRPVLCRVISMVLTRADWPLDRLEEALLVCDALCTTGSAENEQRLTFSFEADEHKAELSVRELAASEAQRLVREASLPLVGNVLERVAERVTVLPEENSPLARLEILLSAR